MHVVNPLTKPILKFIQLQYENTPTTSGQHHLFWIKFNKTKQKYTE